MDEAVDRKPPEAGEVTESLRAGVAGEPGRMERVAPLVYDELRRIAHRQLRHERTGHTLQTTGLVHEAYLRLVEADEMAVTDRTHFFALSARLMRHILLDHARRRRAAKRGGGAEPVELDDSLHGRDGDATDRHLEALIDLDDALSKLEDFSPRQGRVVDCRFFAGMSVQETAEALDISKATVKRDWQLARAWLNRALK